MCLKKYLADFDYDTNLLKRFAFLGNKEQFNKKLKFLERMAETETWHFKDNRVTKGDEIYVLFYYIVHTFDRCFEQDKVLINSSEDAAVFNTGLLTPAGEEIYGLFVKSWTHDSSNKASNYWYLSKWIVQSDRDFMQLALDPPKMASYFEDYNELFFDPELDISPNFDHIYDDNFERLPPEMQQMDKAIACQVFNGFLGHTIKRIKRNFRIPVPQFYRGKIMFLIPVKAFDSVPIVLALEKYENGYRANTILTLNMAYNCARLLMKPESNWLLPRAIDKH